MNFLLLLILIIVIALIFKPHVKSIDKPHDKQKNETKIFGGNELHWKSIVHANYMDF